MTELKHRAIMAGLFFGSWPLLMNRSKLPGDVSGVILSLVSLLVVLPFAMQGFGWSIIADSSWWWAILAGLASGTGVIYFNGGLAATTPSTVSNFFVMMIVVQVSVSAIYQIIVTGNFEIRKIAGFLFAIVTAYLLS